jgi:hypothetical protein
VQGAGWGLFTRRGFARGEVVCDYRSVDGRTLSTKEALKLVDKSYLMRLGPQTYVDLQDDLDAIAR